MRWTGVLVGLLSWAYLMGLAGEVDGSWQTAGLLLQAQTPQSADNGLTARQVELARIRVLLAEKRRQINQLQGQEVNVLQALQLLEERIALAGQMLEQLDRQAAALERVVSKSRRAVLAAQARLEAVKTRWRSRVHYLYRHRHRDPWTVLLSADSLTDWWRRYRFLALAADYDRRLIGEVERHGQALLAAQHRYNGQLAEVQMLQAEQTVIKAELEADHKQRIDMIRAIRGERRMAEVAARELEQGARRLTELIASLVSTSEGLRQAPDIEGFRYLEENRGRLPWPTEGRVVHKFGRQVDRYYGTVTINHGIDIRVSDGAEIRAVGPGRIVWQARERGYGQFVLIDHGRDYISLYAHLGEILVSPGERVEAGQVIARAGAGSPRKGAMLHFEIRRGRQPFDPMDWLHKR